jgi:4-amino-4-deoxy-L-arabinose transferase-like glycosyltransferase
MMTESKPEQQAHPEPSILDYVRAKLMPWRGPAPDIPGEEENNGFSPVPGPVQSQMSHESAVSGNTILDKLPWRALSALLLALVGQYALMPPLRQGVAGAFFFVGAVLMALWAAWNDEFILAVPKEEEKEEDDFRIDPRLLLAGVLVSLIAFFAFSNNLFTDLNVFLWLVGLGLVVVALWFPRQRLVGIFGRMVDFFRHKSWEISISRHMVLLVIVMAVAVFFRVYRMGEVIPEMFSDQAERLWDVYDVLQGETRIFFPRNTGREGLQFYLIAWTIRLFDTGFSFLSMKIGTVFLGIIMLPYLYLLGKELGNRRVGLLAMLFGGISYWPNILARVALRFILYPAFAAPTLYYLVRGLRTGKRNYFILSGIFLGIGLHGYSPFRAVPILVVLTFFLYWLHNRQQVKFQSAFIRLGIMAFISLIVFLPLLRVWTQMPDIFTLRTLTRLTNVEVGDSMASGWELAVVFLKNVWNGLLMFNWDSGNIWVNTIPQTPSLDIIAGAALLIGVSLVLFRYLKDRRWEDGFLLFGLPVLMLPSTLVLAYPAENPAPNRAAGAAIVVFILAALGIEAVLRAIRKNIGGLTGTRTALLLGIILVLISMGNNYSLTFNRFPDQYGPSVWNTSELGAVIEQFTDTVGSPDQAWVMAYPHWVDTRLVGINAGFPIKDFALWPEDLDQTKALPSPKLFLVKIDDIDGMETLQTFYPNGEASIYEGRYPAQSFIIYYVP